MILFNFANDHIDSLISCSGSQIRSLKRMLRLAPAQQAGPAKCARQPRKFLRENNLTFIRQNAYFS